MTNPRSVAEISEFVLYLLEARQACAVGAVGERGVQAIDDLMQGLLWCAGAPGAERAERMFEGFRKNASKAGAKIQRSNLN